MSSHDVRIARCCDDRLLDGRGAHRLDDDIDAVTPCEVPDGGLLNQ
jgi:hypothetical protein